MMYTMQERGPALGRCEVCGWPTYSKIEYGCTPENCCERPAVKHKTSESDTLGDAIRERDEAIALLRRHIDLATEDEKLVPETFAFLDAKGAQRMSDECQAIGPYHGDKCSGGRIQSPNAQFTQDCRACGGTGKSHAAMRAEVSRLRTALEACLHRPWEGGLEMAREALDAKGPVTE